MNDPTQSEAMDAIEEKAEANLRLLAVLDTAQMMRVTREAIIDWIEAERRRERHWFQTLSGAPHTAEIR